MHLIYCDETGNSGNNLDEAAQPVFVLGALIVPESTWMPLETALTATINRRCPHPRDDSFEIKASEIHNPRGYFRAISMAERFALRDELMTAAAHHGLRFVYRAIEKKRYKQWLLSAFGAGVTVNPHLVAFPLVARVVDDYLQRSVDRPQGIFIFDENREVVADVEKSHRLLRSEAGVLQLRRIIEKGFFIDSRASLPLQLCDLCVYIARRMEEMRIGFPVKEYNKGGIRLLEPLIHRGDERFTDVISWLTDQQKKERPGA
jgi:hypothetical protein